MAYNWRMWFDEGDVLETKFRPTRFRIEKYNEDSITVRLLDRKGEPTLKLLLSRLNVLALARKTVKAAVGDGVKLTDAVNLAWNNAEVGEDRQNESQYWALVCERVRRRRRAIEGETIFREGRRILYTLSRSERNPKLRRACIERFGTRCTVCDFDFEECYGVIGKGFIHIHHLTPVANTAEMHDVSVNEMVPVCANCHAMLHQRTPPFTPKELTEMMRAQSTPKGRNLTDQPSTAPRTSEKEASSGWEVCERCGDRYRDDNVCDCFRNALDPEFR